MAKATRVYSTPPTNTPVDPTRRHLLTIAAAGAVAAAIPADLGIPTLAAPAVDPAFVLIAEKLAADALIARPSTHRARLKGEAISDRTRL
jgi:hypothetical protein